MILALYLRLSKEDGDMEDESNSITNQRAILHKYVEQNPELSEFCCKEYVDDGYSGRNFNRPGIIKLLEELKGGKIYGIIVKDFSRFGRNHIEVGDYIEKIFPLLDIRFIAVNNHFDSADYVGITPDMDIPFQNLMYDYFSEENSIKIKNDLFKKRMRGNFMASYAPFGYVKSPQNHNQILVDPEAAQIVRKIFDKYMECGVKAEVARYLNANEIPTPLVYATQKGRITRWKYEEERKFWNGSIVGKILKNPYYIGNMVFHKTEVMEPASKYRKMIPKSEWNVCEETHEAIISKEVFEWVNSTEFRILGDRLEKNLKTKDTPCQTASKEYDRNRYCEGEKRKRGSMNSPIKGYVRCGGCRHHMTRRNRLNASYYCRFYYELKSPDCCPNNVKEAELMDIVRIAVCKQSALVADLKKLLILQQETIKRKQVQLNKEKSELMSKIQKCQDEKFLLYEKYKMEKVSREEFQKLRQENLKQLEAYQKKLEAYSPREKQNDVVGKELLALLEGKEHIVELTRDIVEQLISDIYVYDNNRVEIKFKFADKLKNLLNSTELS